MSPRSSTVDLAPVIYRLGDEIEADDGIVNQAIGQAGEKKIRHIRIDGGVAYVPLTKGYEAVIDADDVKLVGGRDWYALVARNTVYAARTEKKRCVLMHRLLMGAPDDMSVDHRNGDGFDNRRANLRICTQENNMLNQRLRSNNKSGFKGVSWNKARGKWEAQILAGRKKHFLGYHETIQSGVAAYREASARLHGEFGRAA